MPAKKVKLKLVGLDGNAFNLLGHFRRQAIKEGWSDKEISEVIDEATSGDYDHLLQTLLKYSE
jgi:hypothetical protein